MLNKRNIARTRHCESSMFRHVALCAHIKNPTQQVVFFNIYFFLVVTCLSVDTVNSNTTNMNRHFNEKGVKYHNGKQNDAPEDNYEDHDTAHNPDVNFDTNPYYNSENFLHLNTKFYNTENNAYSNYEDYKKYYLNPSNPVPKSNVKFKISSRIVQTKYGKLQGIVLAMDEHRYLSPLEVFLGVPYATPPVGTNRFSPTRTPSPWDGVRVSDRPGPACPQKLPDIDDERTILEKMPKGRLEYLKRLIPYLKNQSEDCLYLNIFAPLQMDETKIALPVLVYIHGESYSWSSSHPYDGAVLASYTDLIVVTLNFRLGVLGFLNANPAPHLKARVANYGLMDQIAALHWVQQNIALFGGDPTNITLMGHGSGAACINFLMISPTVMPGLFHRAILLSGSALSSWAIVDDPVYYSLKLAKHMNCSVPEDLTKDHEIIVDCLREATIEELLSADISPPNFLTAFGPSVDGVVIKTDFAKDFLTMYSTGDFPSFGPLNNMNINLNIHKKRSDSGRRLFQNKYDLLFGVVTSEALWKFSAHDVQNGIEPDKRDRMLRTYVRNSYTYHLSEIFYTIVNEYTDWERTVENPINTRDATVAALSDAQYVAPLVQSGDLLSGGPKPALTDEDGPRRPTKTFFYVFDYQTKDGNYPQRMGAVHGEELPYVLGAPLVDGFGHFPQNYTKSEVALSESIMLFLANFVKTGNPNDNARQESLLPASRERNKFRGINWEEYDSTHQKYLEIGMKPRLKNHYRAHQLSVWLRLVPELHRAGMEDVAARHNLFKNHNEQDLYEGIVRPDPLARNINDNDAIRRTNGSVYSDTALTTVDTILATCATILPGRDLQTLNATENTLANLEAAGYAAYSTALSVTIAIGCSLLILNVLIFAGVYYQRDKSRSRGKQQRFNEKHFETISGKHSHYHMDPTHAPSLVVDIERQNRKKHMLNADPHLSNLNFKGPLDVPKSPPSPTLSMDNMMLPSKLGSRSNSFRIPNVSYPQMGYATMPKNLSQFNNSPPLQELRQQKFQPPNGSTAQNSPGREGEARGPHATLRRGKTSLHSNLPQAAIDEMRV
ncbi:neuroligin-4, Y-linked-like [Trichoplusia ni]|uniref:Neuroligin-4, Y-linked-like n=1 Tax=Trichoplusia ni TaxID=7111 RepID=A0A7E5VE20_TRINI|nr:neuroligin-4, Y-linked-like [Trichoplusia ni]XP_026726553.1 neuroligin-4, Y-linked-like [Trichoplusia ni]